MLARMLPTFLLGDQATMISPLRQEILCHLERVSAWAPEVRFGQLMAHLAFLGAGPWNHRVWDVE